MAVDYEFLGLSLIELVVVIAVLAILSAVAIPAFNGVQANARASAAKNGLVNIVKECVVLGTDTDNTNDNLDSSATFAGDFNGYTEKFCGPAPDLVPFFSDKPHMHIQRSTLCQGTFWKRSSL